MQVVVSIIILEMFLRAIYYLAREVKRWNKGRTSVFTTIKNSITGTVKNCYKATMRFFFKKKIIVEMLPVWHMNQICYHEEAPWIDGLYRKCNTCGQKFKDTMDWRIAQFSAKLEYEDW